MSFRWLKLCADWLDNRFPAKVHVTDEVFQALLKRESERQLRANTQEAEISALTGLAARNGRELDLFRARSRVLHSGILDLSAASADHRYAPGASA